MGTHRQLLREWRKPTGSLRRARAAARAGSTAGGTASVYAPRAWEAFSEFASPADVTGTSG
jgi:hypothetical protein